MINGGISKASPRRSRASPSKPLQEKLLDAATEKAAELQSHREQFPGNGSLAQDATPVQTTKRQLDATSESDPLLAKRTRLTQPDAQPAGVCKIAEQTDETTLQQPIPKPLRRPYASLLRDLIDNTHAESVDPFISEWLESVGSERKERCRSDSQLQRLNDPVSRQLTRSAPVMGSKLDADGFVVPSLPASTAFRSYAATLERRSVAPSDASARSSAKSLVENPHYRDLNLAANNIYMRYPWDPMPDHIAGLVDRIRRGRDSPEPALDEVVQDRDLYDLSMGAAESDVESYFKARIFPKPNSLDSLKRVDRQPLATHTVPNAGSKYKVSNPVPDMLYGYNLHGAFPQQQAQLISMGTDVIANSQNLIYPFFVIEFNADGPSGGGSLWAATNQCLGGSICCVNMAEGLNSQLAWCPSGNVGSVNSAAFSIAMSGTEARLYISWKHDALQYYMAGIESFLLQRPDHYLEFRKYVRNILDWGRDTRLKEIRTSLDTLLHESRKRSVEVAEPRPSASDSSVASSKRGKS